MKKCKREKFIFLLGIVFLFIIYCLHSEKKAEVRTIEQKDHSSDGEQYGRYLAIGFDDFRSSDFTMTIPLFNEYDAHATFNRIGYSLDMTEDEKTQLAIVLDNGNELGDHTWFHCNFIYSDPLFNGQNPDNIEGNQIPFPTNEQMRNDYGDGKNAFGFSLTDSCDMQLSDWNKYDGTWSAFDTKWGDLSDEECQYIRESYSIMCDTSGLLDLLDELSNKYLGTAGASKGSWDEKKQCYTGGIFTNCKTSANHEIWERVIQATGDYYEEKCGVRPVTWSWPGSMMSPFKFTRDDKMYYDEDCTILYNYLAKMPSSLYSNADGTPKQRSWVDVLRENGYVNAHDIIYPSRLDGEQLPMMSKQLIYNASLSRKDALVYRTNSSVHYNDINEIYEGDFFDNTSEKGQAAQMYDDGGAFYTFIESIRQDTSNGMIHGEIIDSVDSESERNFLTQILEYCKKTGVKVISKKDAYNICFNQVFEQGNLIYNPNFRNTAEEFMPDAENIPTNPDGYIGNCKVEQDEYGRILKTEGITQYLHYGIPLGNIRYSAETKGCGNIKIYAIKNSDSIELNDKDLELLGSINVNSEEYNTSEIQFFVQDNTETEFEQLCDGMGEKIMGIKIEYSDGLYIKNIDLEKI